MRVGIANATITPERPIWLTGYASRTEPSDGKYNDLEASAVVFDNGQSRVGILAADLIGLDEFLLDPIRERAAELGIPPECMLVNCSHTHCGPAVRKLRSFLHTFDDEYLEGLKAAFAGLLERAVADLQEAALDYAVGSCTLGISRRRVPDGGGEAAMLPNPDKPVDTAVPVLRVASPEGAVRALLFSYACHPTTMGGQQIGTDYPGPARDVLRDKFPGVVPIFLQGCGGDVKPRNLTAERTFTGGPLEIVYEFGHELGRAAHAALCGTRKPLNGQLAAASAIAELPYRDTPTDERLAAMETGNKWQKAWAEAVRQTIADKGALARTQPVEVQALNIGGLHVVAIAGEACVGIALELKQRLPDLTVLPLGYCNLLRSYIASRGEHAEGGYEVWSSFIYSIRPEPRPLGLKPESVDVLIGKAIELAQAVQ